MLGAACANAQLQWQADIETLAASGINEVVNSKSTLVDPIAEDPTMLVKTNRVRLSIQT